MEYFTIGMNKKEKREYYEDLFYEMLDFMEFELIKNDDGTYALHDMQGGNYGDIESETFNSFASIIERLEIYENDYYIRALEECFPEIEFDSWEDLLKQLLSYKGTDEFADSEYDIRTLDLIVNGINYLKN